MLNAYSIQEAHSRPSVTFYVTLLAALFAITFLGLTQPSHGSTVEPQHHDDDYDVIEDFEDQNGNWVPLRRGNTNWGYEHIKQKHGWTDSDKSWTDSALRNPTSTTSSGTSTTYLKCYYDIYGYWYTRRVPVEYGSGTKGIITSYVKNGYEC